MPPPGFLAAMALAAVAVILIILRIRSRWQLRRSARNLQSSQGRLERSQRRLGDSLAELSAVIKTAAAQNTGRCAAPELTPPAGSSATRDGALCARCGGPAR